MKPNLPSLSFTGIVFAILASNLFSSKVVFAKYAYALGSDPLELLSIRMAVSLPLFAGIAWFVSSKPDFPTFNTRDLLAMAGLGFIGYYTSSLLDFHGMLFLSASLERLVLYLYPVFLLGIRFAWEGTIPSRNEIIALFFAFVGVGVFYWDEHQQVSADAWIGVILVGLAALCYATYLYGSAKYIRKYGSLFYAGYSSGFSSILMLIHFFVLRGSEQMTGNLTVLLIGAGMGILCTLVPMLLLHRAVDLIGSAKVGILGTSGILGPFVLGILFLAEPVSVKRIFGIALVLGAVAIMNLERKRGD